MNKIRKLMKNLRRNTILLLLKYLFIHYTLGDDYMTDDEILNAKIIPWRSNRNGGINKKPGRKAKKEQELNPREDKFVQVYIDTGNSSLAKKEAGYSANTSSGSLLNKNSIKTAISEKRQELWDRFTIYAEEAMNTQLMIMRSDMASYKTRLDATNSILDRAGLKPAERKEIVGADGGAIQLESKVTNELAQRARQLLIEKETAIDV